MKREDAMREILAEWRALPKKKRQTEKDATNFAFAMKNKYKFRSKASDPYQTIKTWLLRDLSLTRGLPD
jgi:hypothetical protein